MLDDRLAISVTTNDGRIIRWGGDEPNAEMVPGDLEFSSTIPGGYKDLSCSLLRRLGGDEHLFNRVRVYGPGGRTAWDGRLVQFPRQDLQINPGAVGWSSHLRDDSSFREIYVDIDVTRWGNVGLLRRSFSGFSSYGWQDPSVIPDPTSGQPALSTSVRGAWAATAAPRCEAWYDSVGIPLGSLYYAWKINANISAADTNWIWTTYLSHDDTLSISSGGGGSLRAAGPSTGTLVATDNQARFAVLRIDYATIAAGTANMEYGLYWTCLGVYGTHGLPKQGVADATHAQGFYGHDIVKDIVSRGAPLLTATIGPGGVETNTSFVIPQASFLDPGTPEDALMFINGYFLNEWGVYDDKKFFWRPPDPTRLTWTVRKDQGARVALEGETAEAQYNGVIVRYTSAVGERKIVGPPAQYWSDGVARVDSTSSSLIDTNPNNAVNAAGIPRRWGVLDVSFATTAAGATQLGYVWLAEHSLPQRRGQITVQGQATHPTEGPVAPWRIRAGDGIVVADIAGYEASRIIETRYSRADDTLTATVGNTALKLDAILERLGVLLTGVV